MEILTTLMFTFYRLSTKITKNLGQSIVSLYFFDTKTLASEKIGNLNSIKTKMFDFEHVF